jgi:hypothetical protein
VLVRAAARATRALLLLVVLPCCSITIRSTCPGGMACLLSCAPHTRRTPL